MNNAYADKYSETSDLAGSVASISINSCENAMKVVFQAKEALKRVIKKVGFQILKRFMRNYLAL